MDFGEEVSEGGGEMVVVQRLDTRHNHQLENGDAIADFDSSRVFVHQPISCSFKPLQHECDVDVAVNMTRWLLCFHACSDFSEERGMIVGVDGGGGGGMVAVRRAK